MAFNGVGVFVRLFNWVSDAAVAINITASRMDSEMDGFASGLSNCITRDGQGKPTSAIDWNGQNLSNVAALSTSGNTTLGDATTDTLIVGASGIVKDTNGNTGIGQAPSAGYRLDVLGTIRSFGGEASASGYSFRALNATNNGGVSLTSGAGAAGGGIINTDSGPLSIVVNGAERQRIEPSGFIQMGGTGGIQRLNLFGNSQTTAVPLAINDTRAADGVNSAGAIITRNGSQVGSISTTNAAAFYNTTSDHRLKDDIVDAADGGSILDAIKVRSFTWKSDPNEEVTFGFIAQELVAVAPQAVKVGGADPDRDPWGVDYSKLVPLLVKELQTCRARISALEGVGVIRA